MTPLYTAVASATAGREGKIQSDDGVLDIALSMPKDLGGPGGPGTNPEQLFAAGYAACFGSALKMVAGQKKIAVGNVKITAKVSIGKEGQAFGLAVELSGAIEKVTPEQAKELMHAAHQVCPYSNATRNNVEVKLSLA